MEINQEALSKYGIIYTGEKEDWIKEFYDSNIKKTIESGDKVYDYESTFNTDNESLANLREQYIYPKLDLQFELDKYKDIDVVNKIIKLMEDKKKILCACDYDCDGLTSGIVLFKYFNNILKYEYVEALPNQRKNGNGFNSEYVQEILDMNREEKISLIATSDQGSLNDESFTILKNQGAILTLVTDHHECPEGTRARNVIGFINPMREDNFVFKGISGCHVAFNLCVAIHRALGRDEKELYLLLPYVGISTVVDQMPLNNIHNRAMYDVGMRQLAKREDYSFNRLEKMLSLPKVPKDKNISWSIGPFFNSGNRCSTERTVFRGFIEPEDNIERFLVYANQENNRRKSNQREVVAQAIAKVDEVYSDMSNVFGIVVDIVTDYGIAGPVASQVGETYNRPTIVFRANKDNTILMGSGRNILNINLLGILQDLKALRPDIVIKAAGHMGACGVEIYTQYLDEFRKIFSDRVREELNGKIPVSDLNVLTYINPARLSLAFALQIESLAPFGNKWDTPLFITKMKFKSSFNAGKSKFCNFYRFGNTTITGIYNFERNNGLTLANWNEKMLPDKNYYVVFSAALGFYRNKYSLDLSIKDIIPVEEIDR